MRTAIGRAMTQCAIRSQRDSRSMSAATPTGRPSLRRMPSRSPAMPSELTRGPSMPRTAGRNVSAKNTDAATVSAPPMPNERSAAGWNSSRPDSPTATASPENVTALPLVATVIVDRRPDIAATAELLAEAADHEQRVVDREGQAEHRRHVLDVDRQLRDLGGEVDAGEGRRDGQRRRRRAACRPPRASAKTRTRMSAANGSDTVSAWISSFSDCSAWSCVAGATPVSWRVRPVGWSMSARSSSISSTAASSVMSSRTTT